MLYISLSDAETIIVCLVDIGGIEMPDAQDSSLGLFNKKASQSGREAKRKKSNFPVNNIEQFFKLSNLMQLSREDYDKYLGYLLTGVDYSIFRRNVAAAMGNLENE